MKMPDYPRRQAAVRTAMKNEGLSALVLYGLTSYAGSGSTGQGYIRYLSGWTSRFGASILVQPVEGKPSLLVPSAHDSLYASEAFPWVDKSITEAPRNYGKLARKILQDMGAERVGLVALTDMPQPVYEDLAGGGSQAKFTPADHLIDALRVTKDASEIEHHRQAARISDEMFRALVKKLRGFRGPAWKLMVEMEYAGRSMGAEIATCWLVTGQPADRPRYRLEENERQVQPGDQILAGTYVTYRGYWGHSIRMGSIGEPSPDYRRIYEATLGQHRAAAAKISPGGDAHLIQIEAERYAAEALPGSTEHPMRSRQGHFLGLDYAEKGSSAAFPQPSNWAALSPQTASAVTLQPGMVLEVHTMLGMAAAGFGFIGDVYRVVEGGAEPLTAFPQELFVI